MTTRRGWIRSEIVLVINLYCKTPFGKIHNRNPEIIELAKDINRTPSAVSWKLANFAYLDESLEGKGASSVSKLDREVWGEFVNNWNDLSVESERLLAKVNSANRIKEISLEDIDIPEGKEVKRVTKTRVNQHFFRKTVLASYDNRCCITEISDTRLLIASHIVPWAKDSENRTNPRNGLCLNSLHDNAFDRGLVTFDEDLRLTIAASLLNKKDAWTKDYFLKYEGKQIIQPKRFLPDGKFLEYHRNSIFEQVEI